MPMLIMGDFNEMVKPGERNGNSMWSYNIREFGNWVDEMEFINLPLIGRIYT